MQSLKWIGTAFCAGGIFLTSFNVFPLNIIMGFVGSGLWSVVGFRNKDNPLLMIEGFSTIVYFLGIITWLSTLWFITPIEEDFFPDIVLPALTELSYDDD